VPYNGRTICEKCIQEQSSDLQECINCEESFYPEMPNQEACNMCLKTCTRCHCKYWDDSDSSICLDCASTAVCANCGQLTLRTELSEQGYCENCSGRMMIPHCVVQYCTRPADSSGYCIEHRNEYKLCPVCNTRSIKKSEIVCTECVTN
jgi:hypothetical protein